MILAEKITNERKRLGLSQEELADQLSVSRQAVSKWESAQATPDLQRILQMAQLFGVSTDYLLKDEMETETNPAAGEPVGKETVPAVSMEEANAFMDSRKKSSKVISLGVAFCIASPALLVLLEGFAESGRFGLSENAADAIGLAVMFVLIGIAVYLFITNGSKSERFEWLEQEHFETAYGVTGLVRERKNSYADTYTRGVAIGVVLCVVACVPLSVMACLNCSDPVIMALVALLLLMVALGVYLIVRVSMVKGSYDILLEEGDYKAEEKLTKEERRKVRNVSGIYWGLATAGYLGWSFATMQWGRTWIVWPVAGVLFAVVMAITKLIVKKG